MTDEKQKQIFAKNLNYYITLNNKQQVDVAKDLDIKPTTFNMWCTGKALPGMGKVQKLADYFRIGKSDLLDDKLESDPVSDARILNDVSLMNMMQKLLKLPLDDRKAIEHLIESLSKKVES